MTIKGVVLSQKPLGEHDKFIDVLTETGMIEILVKGSAKITSKSGSATQLFAYAEFDISDKKTKKNYYMLRTVMPIQIFYDLRNSVSTVALASYFAQVVLYSALPQTNIPEILRLLLNCFYYLSEKNTNLDESLLKSIFELRIASLLGFLPDIIMCRNCNCYLPEYLYFSVEDGCFYCESCKKSGIFMPAGALQAIRHVVLQDLEKIFWFKISERCRKPLFAFAEKFLQYHTDKHFQALEYYKKIIK